MKGRSYRKEGGKVEEGVDVSDAAPSMVYAGEDSNVVKEAKDRTNKFKKGGKVPAFLRGKMAEGMEKKEEKKAKKDGGCAMGAKPHGRLDRPKRASGGVLSTAANTSDRPGGKMEKMG